MKQFLHRPAVWVVGLGLFIILSGGFGLLAKMFIQDKVTINSFTYLVEIADTPDERSKGLSGQNKLDVNRGMLFVYDQPENPAFWMKDMKFPIDIVWIGEDKKVVEVTHNISPSTYPDQMFSPRDPAKYVLEIPAGSAKVNNIRPGNEADIR